MNRRQRRTAWKATIEDLYEDLRHCNPAKTLHRANIANSILVIEQGNPYERDWDQWYEDGDGTID